MSSKHRHSRERKLEQELEKERERVRALESELEAQVNRSEAQLQDPYGSDNEVLFLSAPTPLIMGLQGRRLNLQLPLLRLSSEDDLTGRQTAQLLGVFMNLLKLLGTIVSSDRKEDGLRDANYFED